MARLRIIVTVKELNWELTHSVELNRVPGAGESIDFGGTSIVKVDDVWHTPLDEDDADVFCSMKRPRLDAANTLGDWLDWQEKRGFDVSAARKAWGKECADDFR